MNWEAVSAISELIAAIAVVATLVYLAIQVRQNTSALKSAATQSAHDQLTSLYDLMASDTELGEIFHRALEEPETLSNRETARFYSLMMSVHFKLQNAYLQTRANVYDNEYLESWLKAYRSISGKPGLRRYWEQRRYMFSSEFIDFLESERFSAEPTPEFQTLGINREKSNQG